MAGVKMKKIPPGFLSLTEHDRLPAGSRLRVQVITNSKGYLELNLNQRELRIVPPEIFQFTTTQVLRLAHNYIDCLPSMIAYLRDLKVLDLQHNLLPTLPETLVNCRQLAELQLTRNRLTELPKSIGALKNLRVLALGENQFEHIPEELGLLTSMRMLDLHGNKLWHLPFSLQMLRHLLQLNISDNMFDHVPLVITKITSLQSLNLSRNRLASLPVDFDALRSLRELNLSHNKFVSISSMLVTLKHLKYLSLANNNLKFLPSHMSQLQNLRVLHLQNNCLRHIPDRLRGLQYYNVSNNQLSSFSVEGMRSLLSLTASNNNLSATPRGLYKLKRLKFLYLDNNHLDGLEEDIHFLQQLRVLDVSNNDLTSLPRALYRLTKLHSFNIKGNHNLRAGTRDSDKDRYDTESLAQSKKNLTVRRNVGNKNSFHESTITASEDDNLGKIKSMKKNMQLNIKNGEHECEEKMTNRGEMDLYPLEMFKNSVTSKTASELEHRIKSGNDSFQYHNSLRNEKIIFHDSRSPQSLKKRQAKDELLVRHGTTASRTFHPVKNLKELFFGKSKKTKNFRFSAGTSGPCSATQSMRSVHFPEKTSHTKQPNIFDMSRKNSSETRSSTTIRNSASELSQRKIVKTHDDSADVKQVLESSMRNKTQLYMPSHRKNTSDTESESHGYGTWGSRGHPQYGYDFEQVSDLPSNSSIPSVQESHERFQDYQHQTKYHKRKEGFNHTQHRQKRSFLSDNGAKSDIEFIPYRQPGQPGLKTHQAYYAEDNSCKCYPCARHCARHCYDNTGNKFVSSYDKSHSKCSRHSYREDGRIIEGCSKYHPFCQGCSTTQIDASSTYESDSRSKHMTHPNDWKHHVSSPQSYITGKKYPLTSCMTNRNENFKEICISKTSEINERPFKCQNCFHRFQIQNIQELKSQSDIHGLDQSEQRYLTQRHLKRPDCDQGINLEQCKGLQKNYPTCCMCCSNQSHIHMRKINKSESDDKNTENLRKDFSEFDHILETKQFPAIDTEESGKHANTKVTRNYTASKCEHTRTYSSDDSIARAKTSTTFPRSRSMDSMIDQCVKHTPSPQQARQKKEPAFNTASHVQSSAYVESTSADIADNHHTKRLKHGGTDYNLLGICNQLQKQLNRNILQPVISFTQNGNNRHSALYTSATLYVARRVDDCSKTHSIQSDDHEVPELLYSQPQTFIVTSEGGHFISSEGSKVEVIVPACAVAKSLHVTVQLLFISPVIVSKARKLNYYVENIIAMGPVVYFHTINEPDFNSQATVTIPAPAEVKGGHLSVLTVRKDNSCIPCSSGFRSGATTATLSTWHLTGKVALITHAKCKYKACKSMEQLLHCIGATQI